MDGHQHHLVGTLVVAVDVADEGDVLQIAFQRGLFSVLIAVALDVVDQLTEVLQTVGGILVALGGVGFQHGAVAGDLDDIGGELIQRLRFQRFLQFLVDVPELEQRRDGAAELGVLVGMGDDIQHTDALLSRQIRDDFDGRRTDFARRLVDDTAESDIVPGVRHDGHIGVDVLDFFAVVEALAAHDLMRDARTGEVAFDGGRLGVHPVEDGVVGQMSALFEVLADDVRDMAGLVLLVLGGVDLHLVALAVLGPEGLALALGVVLDDTVGGIQDIRRGAVILLKSDGPGAFIDALEVEDVLNGRAAEAVDALVVVAHDADVLFRAGEQAHEPELSHTGVLILVHQQIFVLVLVELPHVLVLRQQDDRLVDEVVEVEGTGLLELLFVGGVDLGRKSALRVPGRGLQGLGGADELVFPAAHLVDGAFDREELVVHAQLFVDSLHDPLGVVAVVDGKAAGVADLLGPAAENADAGRVEGGGEHLVALFPAQHPAQTLFQLTGGLVGKGDGHDVPAPDGVLPQHSVQPRRGIGAGHDGSAQGFHIVLRHLPGRPSGAVGRAEADEVGDAVDQHGGLSAACTREDEQRAVGGEHRLPLHIVQASELLFDIRITQSAELLCEICCHCFTCSFQSFLDISLKI